MMTNGAAEEPLWVPDPDQSDASALAVFGQRLLTRGLVASTDYDAVHAYSVDDVAGFWAEAAAFLGVRFHAQPTGILSSPEMPGAQWFPGATLNYAEHALLPVTGGGDDEVAVVSACEGRTDRTITYGELRDYVGRARAGLRRLGVRRGDRVVALAPNAPETIVAFLATVSLGAVWSCCSPDFGAHAVLERFGQLEPTVLIAVDGYRYRGEDFDVLPVVERLRDGLATLRATVCIDYLGDRVPDGFVAWSALLNERHALQFEQVSFDHPLWVLYTSGTTGKPKGIVHGHGGIVVEHLKTWRLHFDVRANERLFWFTTTGWMMRNRLVSGLLCGATIVLYDGHPNHPDSDTLWALADRHRIDLFGVSAPYLEASRRTGQRPRERHDLTRLRMVAATGAPLAPECFGWIADAVRADVPIVSCSGGTDVCTAFLGGAPTVPVWAGELSRPALGVAAAVFDDQGQPMDRGPGELVITRPMPSMPVGLWGDADGTRLRATYFNEFPGVWTHGDWVESTDRGSAIVHGRSDATLNRNGVRIGTAELYGVLAEVESVLDSLVIDTSSLARRDGEIVCFLVLADDAKPDGVVSTLRSELRAQLSPRHVPDRFVVVDDIPRTLNGKRCEVPVRRILAGVAPDRAVSAAALANPSALDVFVEMARGRSPDS